MLKKLYHIHYLLITALFTLLNLFERHSKPHVNSLFETPRGIDCYHHFSFPLQSLTMNDKEQSMNDPTAEKQWDPAEVVFTKIG